MQSTPVRIKPKNLKLSKSYIDSSGNLVLHHTLYERAWQNIRKAFAVLPFVASFMLCSLLLAELLCFCGLISTLVYMKHAKEAYSYALPLLSIGIMCTVGFGIAWVVGEEQDRVRYQKALAKEAKRRNGQNDESDYFIY